MDLGILITSFNEILTITLVSEEGTQPNLVLADHWEAQW